MKKLFFSALVCGTLTFSSAPCDEASTSLQNAKKGFQERWQDFHGDTKTFPIWKANWTEEELKNRFDQMQAERWSVYFINPEDFYKPNAIGRFKSPYATPTTIKSWGSRYSFSCAFDYNLANPAYNSSIISLHNNQFLALEAPTKDNLPSFYHVLQQYHVTDLIRLTPAVSNNKENSFPYWEGHIDINPSNGRNTIQIDDWELNYFFTDCWKDHEGLEPEKLCAFIKAVMDVKTDSQMIAVHCKAGVGRTGTFLAAFTLIQEIDDQIANGVDIDSIQVSIDQVIWELSLQRTFPITHYAQYQALYELVNWYIESISIER